MNLERVNSGEFSALLSWIWTDSVKHLFPSMHQNFLDFSNGDDNYLDTALFVVTSLESLLEDIIEIQGKLDGFEEYDIEFELYEKVSQLTEIFIDNSMKTTLRLIPQFDADIKRLTPRALREELVARIQDAEMSLIGNYFAFCAWFLAVGHLDIVGREQTFDTPKLKSQMDETMVKNMEMMVDMMGDQGNGQFPPLTKGQFVEKYGEFNLLEYSYYMEYASICANWGLAVMDQYDLNPVLTALRAF